MKRITYHVIWRHFRWHVRRACMRSSESASQFKYDAVHDARTLARLDELIDGKPSQVVVHAKNGRIQAEWSYGADPRRTPG